MQNYLLTLLFITLIISCKMNQQIEQLDDFNIIGIAIETTNENGQSSQDMSILWGRFFSEQISNQIPNKVNEDIYAIYTDYETDYKGRHTAIIGYKVKDLDNVPKDLIGRNFAAGNYKKFMAKGTMPTAVIKAWNEIWSKDHLLNRTYIADFEVYGAKAQSGADSEVAIYLGVKN